MTVATDIASRTNCERLYVLRIEGLNYDIVQPHDRGAPAGGNWRTNVLQCLEVGSEASMGLDLKTMHVDSSALTFGLRNCYDTDLAQHANACDPNVSYLWAKLFAPGAWCNSSNAWTYLRYSDDSATDQLDADASIIFVTHDPGDRGFAESGTAYIGRETFSYTGHAATTGTNFATTEAVGKFTGVTKGLYPAVGSSNWGYSYAYPQDDFSEGQIDASDQLVVSSVPYTMLGRRVALYVTTWDHASGAWIDINSAELLWVGSISDQIIYDAPSGSWQLSCESMLKDLDREVLRNHVPTGELKGINLQGPAGLTLYIDEFSTGASTVYEGRFTVSFTPGHYADWMEVLGEFQQALKDATYSAVDGSQQGHYSMMHKSTLESHDAPIFTGNFNDTNDYEVKLVPGEGGFHPFVVLGFELEPPVLKSWVPAWQAVVQYKSEVGAQLDAYHPVSSACNGGRLYVERTDHWYYYDQGMHSAERAYWYFPDALPDPRTGRKGWVACSTGHSNLAGSSYLDLDTVRPPDPTATMGGSVGGQKNEDGELEGVSFRGVYYHESMPQGVGTPRGPFELLLYPLLSTGTDAYNEDSYTYDSCPLSMSVGVQESLVDVQSFLDADMQVLGAHPGLAVRVYDFIDEATPWLTLFEREAQLFGKALAWKRGKLTVVDVFHLPADAYTTTLSETTNAQHAELPSTALGVEHVINSWSVEAIHTIDRSKFRTVTLNDAASVSSLSLTAAAKIVHHGLGLPGRDAELAANLQAAFDDARALLRYPWQRVGVTLAPTLQLKVGIGDIVRYQADNHPDPYGSGSMSIDALALVIDFAWDYSTDTGRAALLCYSNFDALELTPWGHSALVDIDATNGGLDAGPPVVLTLTPLAFGRSGDSHDPAAFEEDDIVYVKSTVELDPASASAVYGPCTVDNYASGSYELTFKGTPSFAGWAATSEHVVVAADWDGIPAAQKTRGIWQASKTTLKLDTDPAQRWG